MSTITVSSCGALATRTEARCIRTVDRHGVPLLRQAILTPAHARQAVAKPSGFGTRSYLSG